tara:strand:- start:4262 stop:6280 length:2019 start_codon:yes stop_codon:yes gene_type:complete
MKITTEWLSEYLGKKDNDKLINDLTDLGLEVDKRSKSKNSYILVIDITPNRADCLSIYGIARDLSAKYNSNLKNIDVKKAAFANKSQLLNKIDSKIAPNYSGMLIQGLNNNIPTPKLIKNRLRTCSIQSINFIVDLVNYVMLDIGQPMHAFDFDKIVGPVGVRLSRKGESIKCLDLKKYNLKPGTPVIIDQTGPIAIAGVIGGESTSTTKKTKNILIESAFFSPDLIRKSSKDYRIQTDSSYRFERGVDPNLQKKAIERLYYLITQTMKLNLPISAFSLLKKSNTKNNKKITVNRTDIDRILGIQITSSSINNILKKLEFKPKRVSKDITKITIPSHRFDIHESRDVIEEIARLHGYNKFPSKMPNKIINFESHSKPVSESIAEVLTSRGYNEVVNFSFISRNSQSSTSKATEIISLMNPISEDKAEMRANMIHGLLKNASYNLNRQENSIKLFEIGKIYRKSSKKEIIEENIIAGIVLGPKQSKNLKQDYRNIDFFDVKGDISSLKLGVAVEKLSEKDFLVKGCQSEITLKAKQVGLIGEVSRELLEQYSLKTQIVYFEISLDELTTQEDVKYSEFSIYPKVKRDLTVMCKSDYIAADLVKNIRGNRYKHLINIRISDIFNNEGVNYGTKNITLELVFQHARQTLTDEDVTEEIHKIMSMIKDDLKLEIKS